ncbi:MAG: GNAT family N-acetyltransferase, partial [bacterium]|nr:GNAT family N-acetyltransferase [bacterium]
HPGRTALINELIIDEDYRGMGIGEKLISKIN